MSEIKNVSRAWYHPFSIYTKFSEKLILPLIPTRTLAYQGVRNVSFLENFGYVLNEWSPYGIAQIAPWKTCLSVLECTSDFLWQNTGMLKM